MNDQDLSTLLGRAADDVRVSTRIAPSLRRRIRVRQSAIVGIAAVSLIAVSVGALAVGRPQDPIPPSGDGSPREFISGERASGTENGVGWRMELQRGSGGVPAVCLRVDGEPGCFPTSENVIGDVTVALAYVPSMDRSVVMIQTPQSVNTVMIREVAGVAWGGQVASEGAEPDEPAVFYRFLEGPEVRGILYVADMPTIAFFVRERGTGEVSAAAYLSDDEFPELKGFPGQKELVGSGTGGGGYSVILRQTESEMCLHINDQFQCGPADPDGRPIPLWVMDGSPCKPADDCSADSLVVVIAGQVRPDVARIGIRDDLGTSFVQVGPPYDEGFFSTELYASPGDELELIAYDSDENELGSVMVMIPGQ